MNRSQALKEAVRLFGKHAAVRDEKQPSSPELRAAGSAEAKTLRAIEPKQRTKEQKAALNEAVHRAMYYRFTVGYIGGVAGFSFFSVQGQGDTWDEAFAKVDRIYKVQAA